LEPITHFLTGACLGRAGLNRKTGLATATVTLAAEAPDIDVLSRFKGPVFGFAHHRGFTHSFLGLFLVSGVVVGLMYLIWLARGRKTNDPDLPPKWGLLFLFAYIAGLTHLLLDFTNNYGVRPFWPFSETWYSWDIVFILEPVLWIVLPLGLLMPILFSLVNQEIGARSKGPQGRFSAILALISMVALWGIRDYEHRRAVNALEARLYQNADPIRASAYPYWWNPFRWYGVVETHDFYATMAVDSLAPEVDPEGNMRIRYKPPETPASLAAKRSYLGRVYLDWAKYPIVEVESKKDETETENMTGDRSAYIVRFEDLRYAYPELAGRATLSATVEVDRNLKVVSEAWGSPTGQGRIK